MGYQKTTPSKSATATLSRKPVPVAAPFAAHPRSSHPLLRLQHQVGNRAVTQMLQAKMTVGKANDAYEHEADRVADTVMRMPEPLVQRQTEDEEPAQAKTLQRQAEEEPQAKPLQRQAEEEETAQTKPLLGPITPLVQRQTENEEPAQAKPLQRQAEEEETAQTKLLQRQTEEEEPQAKLLQRQAEEEEPTQAKPLQRQAEEEAQTKPLQRQAEEEETAQAKGSPGATPTVTPNLESTIQSMRGGGKPLPNDARHFYEARMGYDLSGIRIHTDASAHDATTQLNAQAFTLGGNIFFGAGRFEPQTNSGKWLLAHELTHTVQQQAAKPLAGSVSVQAYSTGQPPKRSSPQVQRRRGAIAISRSAPGTIARKVGGKASPAAPTQDPAFKAVVAKSKKAAKQQKKHPPAKKKAAEAQAAAKGPANEVASKAADKQVQQMEQQKPKPFDRKAFKAALLAKIAASAPKTLEQADKFKQDGKLTTVKGELTGQVDAGKQQSQGNIETKVKQPPSTSGITAKSVTPLPPVEKGTPPAKFNAKQAAPKPKTADEVSLQEGSQSLEQKMADADVNEGQLKESNEPDFQGAAAAKNEAQTHANTAPQEYRQGEQAILTQAQAQAQATTQTQLTAMQGTRGQLMNRVGGSQQQGQSKDEQERTRVANEIQAIYNQTKQKAEARLNRLDAEVNQVFDSGASAAQNTFETYVDERMRAYKRRRYDRVGGSLLWAKDKLLGMPSEVDKFYEEGRKLYLKLMDGVLDRVAVTVEKGLNEAKAEITKGKQAVEDYVKKQPANLQKVAKEAASAIQSQFDQLEQSVNDKQNQLIDSLAQKYNEKLQAVDARIDEMKAANRGLVDKAMDAIAGVIKTILELKNMLLGVLAKAADAIGKIIKSPIKFLGNLVSGVKQGFMNFMGNIGTHLKKGLMGWLFGAIAESGIQLPESFDLKGILSLIMQVLGATWAFIRARAVKILGEKVVKAMETTAEIFKILITQGIMGVWEYIKEQLSNLKDVVIGGIQSFVEDSIIKAGVTWILGLLNPAGAFIKACKAIYDIIMFFVERGSQIMALVNAVIDSVSAIANGAIGVAAQLVEDALGKAVPVVISFLAALLGVTGISKKIREIIEKVQAPVSKAIDWVIDKAYSLVKKAGNLLGIGKKKKDPKEQESRLNKALEAAQTAVNRFAGKRVGALVLKPLLGTIRLRYRLASLTVVLDGDVWAVEGTINPRGKKKTQAKAPEGAEALTEQDSTPTSPISVGFKIRKRKGERWHHGSVADIKTEADGKVRVYMVFLASNRGRGQSSPGKETALLEQVVKDLSISPESLPEGGFAKDTAIPEHDKFEPKKLIETKAENGGTQIKYETYGGAQFEALISSDKMTQSISGTKLKLKDIVKVEGRGITEDSPDFIGRSNLNRSHLIADRFLGSGYKRSANLITTSDIYNQKEMKGVEDSLVRLIKTHQANEFNLEVKARFGELKKTEIISEILSKVPEVERATVQASVEAFANKIPNFKVCLGVQYIVSLRSGISNELIMISTEIGPDKYLRL